MTLSEKFQHGTAKRATNRWRPAATVWCLKGTRGRSCTVTSHGRAPHPCRRGDPPIERPRTTSIAVAAKAVPGDPQRNYSGPMAPSAGRAGTATTVGTKLDRHTIEHDNPDSECAQNGNAYRRKRTRPRLPAFIHRRMHRGARARTVCAHASVRLQTLATFVERPSGICTSTSAAATNSSRFSRFW